MLVPLVPRVLQAPPVLGVLQVRRVRTVPHPEVLVTLTRQLPECLRRSRGRSTLSVHCSPALLLVLVLVLPQHSRHRSRTGRILVRTGHR